MKKKYVLLLLVVLFSISKTIAANITSRASGNWNDTATWFGNVVPTTLDNVTIGNHTVTVTVAAFCATLSTNPGDTGEAKLIINSGFKLTVSTSFTVQGFAAANNSTYISGSGEIQSGTLSIGNNITPTANKLTTLFVDNISLFKITGAVTMLTRVQTVTPGYVNECRLKHRSGTIEVGTNLTSTSINVANSQNVSSGKSDLGYRTDNGTLQGVSKIIFKASIPTITASGDNSASFIGGIVEFNNAGSGNYNLPTLAFKELILNSASKTFISVNASTSIIENGKLYLTNGSLTATSAAVSIGFNNNAEIIRSNGIISTDSGRPRLINASTMYNVTYAQNAAITIGRELAPVVTGATSTVASGKLSTITINTTNGLSFANLLAENFIISAVNTTTGVNVTGTLQVDNFTVSANSDVTIANLQAVNFTISANSTVSVVAGQADTFLISATSTVDIGNVQIDNFTNEAANSIVNISNLQAVDFTNEAVSTFTISNLQTVNFTNTAANTFSILENVVIDNLTISANSTFNSDAATAAVKVNEKFSVNNGANVTFTDNLLTLASNDLITARVAPLLNGETISGKINIERYLKNDKRQWRLLTAPVKGDVDNSVFFNWQNNGVGTGDGVELWGPEGTLLTDGSDNGNGVVRVTESLYNMRKWDNDSGAFSNVDNTRTEPLFDSAKNYGFLSFFTHPFLSGTDGAGGYNNGTLALNLKSSGSLITGNMVYNNILNTKYYLIGNPYASPLNFGSMLADSANQGVKKIWLIDPTVGQFGSYITYDAIAGVYSNGNTSFKGSTVVQSGQAFFVLAAGTGSLYTTSLTIKESHKSTASTNATLNKTSYSKTANNSELFRILLEKDNGGVYNNMDGCVAVFYEGGSNLVEGNDAYKLNNPGENLALFNSTTSLCIEHRAAVQDADFLTLRVGQAAVGANYKLKLYTENFTFNGTAVLQDLFLNTSTPVALDGTVLEYPYQVTSNAASTGNRFKVVFKQNSALAIESIDSTQFNVYPNPLTSSETITLQFNVNQVATNYSYKILSLLGQEVVKGDLLVSSGVAAIPLNGKLNSGFYILQVVNSETKEKFTKKIIIK